MSYDWVHGLLQDWGSWLQKHAEHSGYPPETWLYRALTVGANVPMRPAHKVLCLDPPRRVAKTHRAVMGLRRAHRMALGAKYAWVVKSDGSTWTNVERAHGFGVSRQVFRDLVRQAKLLVAHGLH